MREVVSNTSPLLYLHQLGELPVLGRLTSSDLGKGEVEAIAIAHERGLPLILDDSLARRHAGLVGVQYTGTLGVLLRAKKAGHITRVSPLVEKLSELGFYLSVQTKEAILKLADEA